MKSFLKFRARDPSVDLRKFGDEYYLREDAIWRPFRLFGLFAMSAAMIFSVAAILNKHWVNGTGYHAGIWDWCYQNQSDPKAIQLCPKERTHWQHAVIGFLLFAASFGLLASILSILGVFTTPLPKKIYYFHSSGEIFLVSAASSTFALLIYPVSIELDRTITGHLYGIGYGLGWGAAFFFYAAALCMSLDELVRASSRAKCCRRCWKRSEDEENGGL